MAKRDGAVRRNFGHHKANRRCNRRLTLEALEGRTLLAVLPVGPQATYKTVQAAVSQARPGDLIEIENGTYPENVDLSGMSTPGSLTLRGKSAAGVILAAPSGVALFNSGSWAGDLTFEHLTIQAPSGPGLQLHSVPGNVQVVDAVFSNIGATAVELTDCTGGFSIRDSQFLAVGQNVGDHAIHLTNVAGQGEITHNTIQDAKDTGIVLENSGNRQVSVLVNENTINGDGNLFSTTRDGVRASLAGTSQTDLTLDNNILSGLAAAAIDVQVSNQAQLQTRWSRTNVSSVNGVQAMQLQTSDTARVAVALLQNNLSYVAGGVAVTVHGGSQLRGIIDGNTWNIVGAVPGVDALTIATDASNTADGLVDVRLETNDVTTVTGDGFHLVAAGQAPFTALLTNNLLSDVNGASGVLIEQAAGASAPVQLRLLHNSVSLSAHDAYTLQQAGTGSFQVEGSGNDVAASLGDPNNFADGIGGQAVVVTGNVALVTPGTFDGLQPLLVGDHVWVDANADGLQTDGESGLGGVLVMLTGTETGTGAAVARQTQTDAAGTYQFVGLHAGSYTLKLDPPYGYQLTKFHQGSDGALDSDFAPTTRQTAVVPLAMGQDESTLDAGLLRNWQNPRLPFDVDDDRYITPQDVLDVINDLNSNHARRLTPPPTPPEVVPPPYLDVNGDGDVTPQDVLQLINYLNGVIVSLAAAEGESPSPTSVASINDAAGPTLQAASIPASTAPTTPLPSELFTPRRRWELWGDWPT